MFLIFSPKKLVAAGEMTTVAVPVPVGGQPAVQPEVRTGFNDAVPLAPNVPLAPIPEQGTNEANPISGSIPLAPMQETTTNVASLNASMQETTTGVSNQTINSSSTVPLAPFPESQKSGATTFSIINISVYTIVSIIIANIS